jgi:ribosome maturation factor RimP
VEDRQAAFLRVYHRPAARAGQNPEGLGVTHNDCQRVSEQLSVILDVEDLVPGSGVYRSKSVLRVLTES